MIALSLACSLPLASVAQCPNINGTYQFFSAHGCFAEKIDIAQEGGREVLTIATEKRMRKFVIGEAVAFGDMKFKFVCQDNRLIEVREAQKDMGSDRARPVTLFHYGQDENLARFLSETPKAQGLTYSFNSQIEVFPKDGGLHRRVIQNEISFLNQATGMKTAYADPVNMEVVYADKIGTPCSP
jgi:hypothetical protein